MGKLAGKNTTWASFPHASCPGGTWSACAASIYNNGANCKVQLFNQTNLKSAAGTSSLVLARQQGAPRLADVSMGSGSWNRQIRSNNWIC